MAYPYEHLQEARDHQGQYDPGLGGGTTGQNASQYGYDIAADDPNVHGAGRAGHVTPFRHAYEEDIGYDEIPQSQGILTPFNQSAAGGVGWPTGPSEGSDHPIDPRIGRSPLDRFANSPQATIHTPSGPSPSSDRGHTPRTEEHLGISTSNAFASGPRLVMRGSAGALGAPSKQARGGGKSVSSTTCKQNRPRAEIKASNAIAAEKKAERIRKAAERLEAQRLKTIHKGARAAVKETRRPPPTPRALWTEDASLELLCWYNDIKDEFDEIERVTPGFTVWLAYYNQATPCPQEFPLLAGRAKDSLTCCYRAMMSVWRAVYDALSHSGSGGLYVVLTLNSFPESLWNAISAMHGDNPATVAYGHNKMNNTMDALVADIGLGAAGDTTMANTHDVQGAWDRQGTAGLSAAKEALDAQTGHGDDGAQTVDPAEPEGARFFNAAEPTNWPTIANPGQPMGDNPVPLPTFQPPTASPFPPLPPAPQPPKPVELPTRRRGRTEVAKPDDTVTVGVLTMMAKAQETTGIWMMEERQRQSEALKQQVQDQADERMAAATKADEKDAARALALKEAKAARAIAQAHLKLEKDNYYRRAWIKEEDRCAREAERKAERQEAISRHEEEARRYDAAQLRLSTERAAQDKSRQLFETAMLTMLANLSKNT
ncbi:hypothetical protein PTTG_27434 [Puccinia triticina 1-1 BBBD Race 1]|uniref:Uncharacterized protein n=1 Tax=Puccinia triticina (isolate 1-1 / race 1 (BBBD)) TaxID=630390 RepID=A0A180GKW5_PUCT1|nr:hypothetical protein PTTG_27434 [Puccinia triticina 1-1 BBBD Race 1]